MNYNRELTININPKAKLPTVAVKQCDANSNVFVLHIVNDDVPVLLTDGMTVNFRCTKPSGFGCCYPITVNSDGTATLVLSAESTAESGLVLADISIEEDGVVLSTAAFWLNVVRSGIPNHLGGTNEYVELNKSIEEVEKLIKQFGVSGDKAHLYLGFIGSGSLADYTQNGWYYIFPQGEFTDAPDKLLNICFLHVWRSSEHIIQELYIYPYTVWRRDITQSGTIGKWFTNFDRKTLTAANDVNTITTPGVYNVWSDSYPQNLPVNNEGTLIVPTSVSLATQIFITLDGRLYTRRTGRDWYNYANPYVSWNDRILSFVAAMNDKAKKIGMTSTTFRRPSGEGIENLSTPNDMLKCCVYANAYPIRKYAGVDQASIRVNGENIDLVRNTDYDILKPDYVPVWGKTGSIPSSESPVNGNYRTLMCVAYHKASKRTIAGVIMLAKSETGRFLAMKELLDATIRVLDGSTETVTLENATCGASCEVFDGCPNVVPVVEVNADMVSCPASMTKTMTAIVGLDCNINLLREYNVRNWNAERGGNLNTNDRISLDDLYTDMMIMSVNAAAYQIADVCGEFYSIIRNGGKPI